MYYIFYMHKPTHNTLPHHLCLSLYVHMSAGDLREWHVEPRHTSLISDSSWERWRRCLILHTMVTTLALPVVSTL